jgi:hypothetical protein
MARTLTVATALNLAKIRFKNLVEDGLGARFADEIIAYMWTRYPWRESLEELPPFHLTRDEADYGAPLLAVPADFYGLHDVRVRSYDNYVSDPLFVHKELRYDGSVGIPSSIAYQKEIKGFRVHPVPNVGGAGWWVEGSYKKLPVKVTNSNVASYVLPWDDIYFGVFRAGLAWKIADEIQADPKAEMKFVMFSRMLERMAMDEGVHEGGVILAPSDALELGG